MCFYTPPSYCFPGEAELSSPTLALGVGSGRLAFCRAGLLKTRISPTLESPGGRRGQILPFFQSWVVLAAGLTLKWKEAFSIAESLPRASGSLASCMQKETHPSLCLEAQAGPLLCTPTLPCTQCSPAAHELWPSFASRGQSSSAGQSSWDVEVDLMLARMTPVGLS